MSMPIRRGESRPRPQRRRTRADERPAPLPEAYQVVIQCRDEAEQRAVYERLTGEGHRCRLTVL